MKNKEQLIKNAYFEGGKKAMDAFIQAQLKYPASALEHKIEGKVNLFLDIDKMGKVTKVKVISGIGHGCDEEAVRVVKLMIWQVDKLRNMHVVYHQRLTISFKIPVPQKNTKEVAPIPSIIYTYVTSSEIKTPNTKIPEQKNEIFYTYTI